MTDSRSDIDTALTLLRSRCGDEPPRIAVVLGSGWGGLTARLQDAERIPYAELPGFPVSTVAGHDGALWLGRLGTHRLAVRVKHDARSAGFDFERTATVTLRPAQILVIDFDPGKGGITLQ